MFVQEISLEGNRSNHSRVTTELAGIGGRDGEVDGDADGS